MAQQTPDYVRAYKQHVLDVYEGATEATFGFDWTSSVNYTRRRSVKSVAEILSDLAIQLLHVLPGSAEALTPGVGTNVRELVTRIDFDGADEKGHPAFGVYVRRFVDDGPPLGTPQDERLLFRRVSHFINGWRVTADGLDFTTALLYVQEGSRMGGLYDLQERVATLVYGEGSIIHFADRLRRADIRGLHTKGPRQIDECRASIHRARKAGEAVVGDLMREQAEVMWREAWNAAGFKNPEPLFMAAEEGQGK